MSTRGQRVSSEQAVAGLVVVAATAFVLWQLYPELVFRDTTPVQGDLGEHLIEPAHMRDHLIPRWALSGWSQAWFAGYPSFTYYFPLPSLIAVLADVVLPYNVAFKLSATLGAVGLPIAAYTFARLNQRPRAAASAYAVAAVVVVLQPLLFNVGGSVASSALGEYAYGVSLTAGIVALGLASAGLRSGGYRALTAVFLAACVLSHVLPAITVAVGLGVLTLQRRSWSRVRWTATTGAVAAALAGFWLIPLLVRFELSSGPVYDKSTPLASYLLPGELAPVIAVAALGLVGTAFAAAAAGRTRDYRAEVFLVVMAATSAALVVFVGEGRIENRRFLACWFFWVAILAAEVLSRAAHLVDERRAHAARGRPLERPALARLVLPVVLLMVVMPAWDTRLGKGILTGNKSDFTAFPKFFFAGLERNSTRAEFEGFIGTVRRVADTNGCGRAHVEWNEGLWWDHRLPLTDLMPYWTDGCITVTSGLSVQSSASGPYLGYTNERLSADPVVLRFVDDDRREFDLTAGVADLRLLGVRYYVASDPRTQAAAAASPDLRLAAETRPYDGRHWEIYELPDAQLVEPLRFEPVVVDDVDHTRRSWDVAMTRWYDSGAEREVLVAADGPASWPAAEVVPARLPRSPVLPTTVSNVVVDHHRMSFDVADTGRPVVVKVSYFPNWQADGADGPWRVSPNFMVVVPRARTVTLRYTRTLPDHAGMLASLAGIGGLALLGSRPRVPMPQPVEEGEPDRRRRPSPPRKRKGRPTPRRR